MTVPVLGGTTTQVQIDMEKGSVSIPPRIDGPRYGLLSVGYNGVHDGPGVLRVNDIDVNGEDFGGAFEPSFYGQTTSFGATGDSTAFCLGGFSCASLVTFGTQGDLPISWRLKASLADPASLRSVTFTQAMFDAWEQGWQNYYCGKGAHPTLPLAPGTNSPTPNGSCPAVVNLPETRPTAAPQVTVNPAVVVIMPANPVAKKKATKAQKRAYTRCVRNANKKHSRKARRNGRAKCARMPH